MFNGEFIKELRLEHGYSQEEIGGKLGISRPSYDAMEKGKKEPTLSQIRILSEIYGITLAEIMEGKLSEPKIFIEPEKGEKKEMDDSIRISIPQKNIQKFREVLLYVLAKVGAKPNVGQTVLYKIVYFIDFDYYEKYEEQLMGISYLKNHHGPTPIEFKTVIDKMVKKEELVEVSDTYFKYEQTKYLPRREADLSLLSAREIKHIDEELERLGDKNATELSKLSHEDVPWITAKEGKLIDYEAVFYRTEATSVRSYEEE
jgi:transcriptional regulator with XRE-family HTH domain